MVGLAPDLATAPVRLCFRHAPPRASTASWQTLGPRLWVTPLAPRASTTSSQVELADRWASIGFAELEVDFVEITATYG